MKLFVKELVEVGMIQIGLVPLQEKRESAT